VHPPPGQEAIIRKRVGHAWFVPVVVVAVLALRPGAAAAQEEEESGRDRWKVSAEMSYTDQSGNRVLRLLTGGVKLSHLEQEDFRLEAALQSRYGKSEGEVVARNHYASVSFDLHPLQPWSPFLFADVQRDEFKRLDIRLSGGAGAKYTFYRPEDGSDEVSLSLAVLYSYEDIRATETDPFPRQARLARWSLRARGSREIRPGITLQHVSFYQPVWDRMADYLLRTETEARVLLTERLALSVAYELNRTARPPEGVGPDDRLFRTGFIIDF
jgi:Protein of unknown function, DUF481